MHFSKIYKKASANGVLNMYLEEREYISHEGKIGDVFGAAHVPHLQEVQDKVIMASLMVIFRFGREEDEVMGISFTKEFTLDQVQVNLREAASGFTLTKAQKKLKEKLGENNVMPFKLSFPKSCPNSAFIHDEEGSKPKHPLGVIYAVRLHLGKDKDDFKGSKASSVRMTIDKMQGITPKDMTKPKVESQKTPCFGGACNLQCSLPQEYYCASEQLPVHVLVENNSRKSIKEITLSVIQNVRLEMINEVYSMTVAKLETKEGCPVPPEGTLDHVFHIRALPTEKRGVVFDPSINMDNEELYLASSTLLEADEDMATLGLVISYSVHVTVHLTAMGGCLEAEVPFKLVNKRINETSASNLDDLKTSIEKDNSRLRKRRQKFQAQDSVLIEGMGNSLEE